MNKVYLIPIVFFTLLACKETVNPSIVIGKWKLIETLYDPGDGSGVYMPYDGNQIATIFADSSVSFTESFCFSEIDSEGLEAQLYPDSIHWPDCDLSYRYQLEGQYLYLYPPCIEPCGLKFEKIED